MLTDIITVDRVWIKLSTCSLFFLALVKIETCKSIFKIKKKIYSHIRDYNLYIGDHHRRKPVLILRIIFVVNVERNSALNTWEKGGRGQAQNRWNGWKHEIYFYGVRHHVHSLRIWMQWTGAREASAVYEYNHTSVTCRIKIGMHSIEVILLFAFVSENQLRTAFFLKYEPATSLYSTVSFLLGL